MPGPLPKPAGERQRRNRPTIPTTNLPAGGFRGEVPAVPKSIKLGKAGRAWWLWAWRTPHAAAWSEAEAYVVARRAQLEDDMRAVDLLGSHILEDVDVDDIAPEVKAVVDALARQAAGKVALSRAATDLEDRLGLSPKAMAALRWSIVDDEPEAPAANTHRRTLKAV